MASRSDIQQSNQKPRTHYSTNSLQQQQNKLISKQSTIKIGHSDNSIQQDLSPYPEMITPVNKPKSLSIKDRFNQSKLEDGGSNGSSGNLRDERNSDRWSHMKPKSVSRSQRPLDRSNNLDQQRQHSSSHMHENTSHRQRMSMSPSPRALSNAHNTAAALTRSHALYKFQNAVQRAIQKRREQLVLESSQVEETPQSSMSPNKKNKQSLFKVVMNLIPFGNRRKQVQKVLPIFEKNNSEPLTQRELLESENFIQDQDEINRQIQEQKRIRARQLWRKAKSVLRAIMTWKAIQSEIQLYGTHNYEFRRNFKMTRSGNILKGHSTIKESSESDHKRLRYSVHPDSKFKKIWSVVLIFLLIYVATIMPFNIAFVDLDESQGWFIIDTIIDFAFITDVLINFISGYIDEEGNLISENRKIAKKYVKSWFFIDIIASFPINLVQRSILSKASKKGNYNQILRLLRLPRLYRLLKIARLVKLISFVKRNPFIQKMQDFMAINSGVMKLMQFLLTGVLCIHLSACMWFLAAKLDDFSPDSWVVRNGMQDDQMGRQYLASLYWAITTILTVGYGDIVPGTNGERGVCIVWMVIGVGFYSFTIGTLTSILSRIDTRSSQLKDKVEVIEVFCQEAKINQQLKKRIKDVLEYNSIRNAFSWIEKYSIFNELPPNLKCEIAMQIHNGAIGKLPFFAGKDQTFIGNIVPLLQPLRVQEYEYIYMQDDHPYELYFIIKGRVNFVIDIGECVFKQWPQGSYFGEIEIIMQKKRICTAKAATDCDLFTLNKKFYHAIIQNDYPEVAKKLRDIAHEREARIEHGFKKSLQVLDAVGIHDSVLPLTKLSRMGSLASAGSTNKQYFNAFSRASANQALSNFRKFSQSQRSMMSKPSQENLIQSKSNQNRDSHTEESDESSENYNIWGDKEKATSSEEDKKEDKKDGDSFHTDKSMKDKNPYDKDDKNINKKSQFKKRSSFQVQLPGQGYDVHQQLDLVKESSFESGSLKKSNKRQREEFNNQGEDDKNEKQKSNDEQDSSIPKIRIIHEPDVMHQDTDNMLMTLQLMKSPSTHTQNNLDVISNNFQDSHFFSNQNDSPPMFKNNEDHYYQGNEGDDIHNLVDKSQSTQFYENMQNDINAPKIKINDKTYNYSQQDSSSHKRTNNHSNADSASHRGILNDMSSYYIQPKPLPLIELEVASSIVQLEIAPLKQTLTIPQTKLNIRDVNEEVVSLKNYVKEIQKEMQSNKFQQITIQDKIVQITSSLTLISSVIKDISAKQNEQQLQIQNQEQRIKQQESQKFNIASSFRPRTIMQQFRDKKKDKAQSSEHNQSSLPHSFSLNSNNSLVPVQRPKPQLSDQQNTSNEHLRIPAQSRPLTDRSGGIIREFSYNDDLENLQREYEDAQEISQISYSLPDQ